MKKFLTIIFLVLFSTNISYAEDISDFQIEGISVGDSLLDHYSEREIIEGSNGLKSTYTSNKMIRNVLNNKGSEIYNHLGFHYANDGTYRIESIAGLIPLIGQMKKCSSMKKNAAKDIQDLFPSAKVKKNKWNYTQDPTKKSVFDQTKYSLNGGEIVILCRDWSEHIEKKNGWIDNLSINVRSSEFTDWLINEAYK